MVPEQVIRRLLIPLIILDAFVIYIVGPRLASIFYRLLEDPELILWGSTTHADLLGFISAAVAFILLTIAIYMLMSPSYIHKVDGEGSFAETQVVKIVSVITILVIVVGEPVLAFTTLLEDSSSGGILAIDISIWDNISDIFFAILIPLAHLTASYLTALRGCYFARDAQEKSAGGTS